MFTLTNNNIRQMVAQAIQKTLAKGYPNWQAAPTSPSQPINAVAMATFKTQDIKYFDPNPSKNAIKIKENHTVYHNVFSFTNCLQVKVANSKASKICQNLNTWLLDKAKLWYTKQLSNLI